MTSLGDMQNRIADELGQRTDLAAQITLAIQTAVAKWEREGFYGTEIYNTALLTTVAGQEFYGGPGTEGATTTTNGAVAAGGASLVLTNAGGFGVGATIEVPLDNGDLLKTGITAVVGSTATISPLVPANRTIPSGNQVVVISAGASLKLQLPRIEKLSVLVTGNRYFMNPRTWAYIEDISVNPSVTGQPVDYAYFGGLLRFYPIPDGAYPVTGTSTQRLTALSVPADVNFWTADAEALIRCEAKMDLYYNKLQEPALGDQMKKQIYGDPMLPEDRGYLYALQAETANRRRSKIRPSYF